MDAREPGGLGGTYAASPPACAAALAVLDVIEKESLVERANEIGARLKAGLQELAERFPGRVGDIRGKGAMVAMELVRDNDPGQPDAELTAAMVKKAGESGLLIISCGVRSNAIRVLAPLTIPFKHLREGLEILGEVMADCV
jgi:4-aminobutyrate aminotransferase/(S)-3-amino-2-methylpropionate transaminase